MRNYVDAKLIAGRVREGPYRSDESIGLNGFFRVWGPNACQLVIAASDGTVGDAEQIGWEHVSVSTRTRCPNWPEMCFVKELFWHDEETVVQFHPPKSTWISNHPYCLHLWKDARNGHLLPPSIMVGVKEEGEIRGPAHAAELRRKYQ